METITLRVDTEFAQEMEKAMHPYYSTKTEFIREAIRDKLKKLKTEELKLKK
jgi:metal-responsive CopG/Arc/MetJ family transcriptional regulator